MDLKWVALISLVVQNSGLAIAMRYTFVLAASSPASRYIASTAVLQAELLKLLLSSLACLVLDCSMSLTLFRQMLLEETLSTAQGRSESVKLLVPSLLYTLQNSLQYFSVSCLSAAVFQVLYQMKIITTAVFSVLLLGKRLSGMQWGAILALALGVALVQLSQNAEGKGEAGKTNSVAGLVSVMLSCLTSGFAGVYFEMVLKSSKASVWLRNVQLSMFGIVIASFSCYYRDFDQIYSKGFFAGYNGWVWTVVILQAAGGLIVAVVVKYADNVLKGFATSISIILSAAISAVYFHDVDVNTAFTVGALVVLASVYLYGYVPPRVTTSSQNIEEGQKLIAS